MIKKIFINFVNIIVVNFIKLLIFFKSKIRRIRKIEFEYFSKKYRLYDNKYFFIIFGQDKYISRETYINGPHDYHLFKKTKKLLKKKIKYLIDVGSNIGTFCIPPIKDKLLTECIAIEPVEKIYDVLNMNILLNGVNNKINTYNYVISNKTNENLSLTLNKNNYGDNQFKITTKQKKKFKIVKLDYFINTFNLKNLLIKIDVQGFENKVLLGSKKFILKKVPMLIEFDKNFLKKESSSKIISLLKRNYEFFYNIDDKNLKKREIKYFEKIFNKPEKIFNILIF